MKKSSIGLLSTLLFLGLCLSSCKKDPTFSDKMVGTWKSVKVTYDGADVTSVFSYTIILSSNKSFDLTKKTPLDPSSIVRKGVWENNDSREEIILRYDDSSDSDRFDISSLTDHAMNAETILNGKRLDIQFSK